MTASAVCQHCGAPWQPRVTGACRYCGVVAPPADRGAGLPAAGPMIDADVLTRRLLATTTDPVHPLDALSNALVGIAGDRVETTPVSGRVGRLAVTLDDWRYEAMLDHDDATGVAVHTVRGVVLKRQPLPFGEWIAVVSAHLAEYAGNHPRVYDAIVRSDGPPKGDHP